MGEWSSMLIFSWPEFAVSRWAHALRLVAFLLFIFDTIAFIAKICAEADLDMVKHLPSARLVREYGELNAYGERRCKYHSEREVRIGQSHRRGDELFMYIGELVAHQEFRLEYCPDEFKWDKDVVMTAVTKRGSDLRHAHE